MPFRSLIAVTILLAIIVSPGLTRAQTPIAKQDRFTPIRTLIATKLAEEKVPSIAVGVAQKGAILWEEAFGLADIQKRVRATQHTLYPIGSVAKPLTATGLMLLVQKGLVDLDQPVNRYLSPSGVKVQVGDESKVTVRRLANHSSGIARHSSIFYADEPVGPPPIEESIRRYGHVVREPGENYEYSNFGFSLIAHLIERTSRLPFGDFMQKELFEPLEMNRSSVGKVSKLAKHYATGYALDGTPIPLHKHNYPGGGGIYSSAHDLVRFGMFHQKLLKVKGSAIIDDKLLDEMHRPSMDIPGVNGFGLANNSYGIGWNIAPDRYGYKQVFHTGHDGYSTALLTIMPDEDICVVVLINGGNSGTVVSVADQILAELLPKYAEQMKAPVTRPAPTPNPQPSYSPTELLLGQWSGSIKTYAGTIPIDMWFKDYGDIHIQMQGQLRTLLSGVRIENGYLRGSFSGDIGTDDANRRRPYNLHVKLKQRGNALNGSVTAATLPGKRAGDVYSYWIELKKK